MRRQTSGLQIVSAATYHPRMHRLPRLITIAMILFLAGCEEQRSTSPYLPPETTVQVETVNASSERIASPESTTERIWQAVR